MFAQNIVEQCFPRCRSIELPEGLFLEEIPVNAYSKFEHTSIFRLSNIFISHSIMMVHESIVAAWYSGRRVQGHGYVAGVE